MSGRAGEGSRRLPGRRTAAWFLAAGWVVLAVGLAAVVSVANARHRVNDPGASAFLVVGLIGVSAASTALLGLGVVLGLAAFPSPIARAPGFVLAWGLSAFALLGAAALLAVASCPV
jgi:hypothetical protein